MSDLGVRSDAASGRTINASVARATVAFFLQLVDQTISAVVAGPRGGELTATDRRHVALPTYWLSDEGGGAGARMVEPGSLWGGVDLRLRTE